jgi:alkylation response protein AidB-like acyl-CoA dehydrogenase
MEFSYSEEQADLRETIIRFARKELNEGLEEREKLGEFPYEAWRKCADIRLLALPFPEEYGGSGVDFLTTVLAFKALGYACRDAGLVHAMATQVLCGMQINAFGSDSLKQKYLPDICNGRVVMAQAITEPGSGSDALSMRTRAERKGDSYLVKGAKIFISNGPIADGVIVFAVTNPDIKTFGGISCLVVDKEFPGFTRCRAMEKMGLSTLQNGELSFDDCQVPLSNLVGREGQGAMIFNESMELERILIPATHLGTLERVMEDSIEYAKQRHAFGQPIGKHQAVANKIVEMKTNLELGKLILCKAAALKDMKKRAGIEAAIGKLFVSESLKKACLDAVQIHGGFGYMKEGGIERDLRDSIASTIYSGTSELQQNIIARLIGI